MRFSRFEFKNFKGIHDAAIDIVPPGGGEVGPIALVGLNESGKTTILEGIDSFYPGEENEEIKPRDLLAIEKTDPYDLIPISDRANFNSRVEVIASLLLDQSDKEAIRSKLQKLNGFVITELPDEIRVINRYTFQDSTLKLSGTYWPALGSGRTKQGQVQHDISP